MPNYANPLDHFRSHSYHFILTLANSTEAFRKLIEQDGFMSSVNSTELGQKLPLDGEEAYLLIDTRRYSQFSVTKFDMNHVYGTGNIQNPSVPASEMKMTVVDSTGITFFNFLMDVMRNKIQSTRASAFFLLSILFVGHNDGSTHGMLGPQQTEVVSTCYIPMILMNMGFDFSHMGSTYELDFMEIEGNPGAGMPQMIDLGDVQAISTEGKANTVGGLIQALEDQLNLKSLRFYQKYSNDAFSRAQGEQKNAVQAGKLVQSMITLPKEWENFKVNTAGKSRNYEQQFLSNKTPKTAEQIKKEKEALDAAVASAKKTGDSAKLDAAQKARSSFTSFTYATSVPDAIKIILESSKEYLDLGSTEKRKQGAAVIHKTLVNVTSDHSTYVMHYDIYPFSAPKVKTDASGNQVFAGSIAGKTTDLGQVRNLIEYDYIFSGKNSHILDLKIQFSPAAAAPALDMDLNLGQSRFAGNSEAGQKESNVEAASVGLNKTREYNPSMRSGEPVFPPTKTKEQQNHFTTYMTEEMKKEDAIDYLRAKQQHTATLATLHFLGSLDSQLTIRGNPNLMRKYADRLIRGGMAPHTLSMNASVLRGLTSNSVDSFFKEDLKTKITGGKEQYFQTYVLPRHQAGAMPGQNDPVLGGPDVAVGPLFVKVNIFSPNTDYLGNKLNGFSDTAFTNEFFFKGVYFVALINHTFDNGSFKQMLSLLPYDVDGTFSEATTAGTPNTASTSKKI